MLSQQTRRTGKRTPRRLEVRGEARNRAPQTARPESSVKQTMFDLSPDCVVYSSTAHVNLSVRSAGEWRECDVDFPCARDWQLVDLAPNAANQWLSVHSRL